MNPTSDVICAGDLMVECLLPVQCLPNIDTTLILDSATREIGGPAYNICWYFSELGLRPLLVAPSAENDKQLIVKICSKAALSRDGLIPVNGNADLLIALLKGRHHRSIYLRSCLPKGFDRILYNRCSNARRLVLTGSRHAAIRKSFLMLADRFRGDLLAFNPSYAIFEYTAPELKQLLRQVHVTLLNELEARHACQILRVDDFAHLARITSGLLLITRGSEGVEMFERQRRLSWPSIVKSSSSAIGAGDAFFTGVLFGLFQQKSTDEALRLGTLLAAAVVEAAQVRIDLAPGILASLGSNPFDKTRKRYPRLKTPTRSLERTLDV